MRKKKLTKELVDSINVEIKMLLHASRDCLRNQGKDSANISFSVNCAYYGECFGIMRALSLLGYGLLESMNTATGAHLTADAGKANLLAWFQELRDEVLEEENFRGSNECEYCFKKYNKDAARAA